MGALWLLQACKSTKHVTNFQYNQNKITILKSEFITVKNDKTIQRKFIVIKPESLPFPIALYKLNDNDYNGTNHGRRNDVKHQRFVDRKSEIGNLGLPINFVLVLHTPST